VPLLAAAIAFYGILSVSPVLVIALFVAGLWMDEAEARARVFDWFEGRLGTDTATMLSEGLRETAEFPGGGLAAVLALGVLLLASTRLFANVQTALDRVWHSPESGSESIWDMVRGRVLGVVVVVLLGLFMVLAISAKVVARVVATTVGVDGVPLLWQGAELLGSILLLTPLVVFVFRQFPKATVKPRHAWEGALLTSSLLVIGTQGISWYVTDVGSGSTFGAAGALVAFVLWIYYATQVFLVGALITWRFAGEAIEARPPLMAQLWRS